MFERAAPPAKSKVALDASGAANPINGSSGGGSGSSDSSAADIGSREVVMPAILPVMSSTPGSTRWAGAALGHHTEEVLRGELGLADAEITRLRGLGAIA
jgi:hypothetical protein